MMNRTFGSQRLFEFLSEFQDTISAGTAIALIREFDADFELADVE